MSTKLTLRLDERLVRRAKAHARQKGKSVSQMVAEYFSFLGSQDAGEGSDLTPTVRSLRGVLRGSGVDRGDHRRRLQEKYL